MSTQTVTTIEHTARNAKHAAHQLATLSTAAKNAVLETLAQHLIAHSARIIAANSEDLARARDVGLGTAKLERLRMTPASLNAMADGVRQVAALPDPVGQSICERTVPSGLRVSKVRCPLGVVMMIYESRPNVTIDAFALCFKSGNAAVLKGGREASQSNSILVEIAHAVLRKHGVAEQVLTLIPNAERAELREWLLQTNYIDLVIPRGGVQLIEFVRDHSKIPTVQHFHGICHVFVDRDADLEKALNICVTAKTSAPATCNAVETILVHADVAAAFVPRLIAAYAQRGVEVRGDRLTCELAAQTDASAVIPATESDWATEYLDLVVSVRCVADLNDAVSHIARYGSNHTDAIVTENPTTQVAFAEEVRSSCVLINASTRFNDGMQLGLGAEIGISTSRMHAYGPMGLEELTVARYVVHGDGHTR